MKKSALIKTLLKLDDDWMKVIDIAVNNREQLGKIIQTIEILETRDILTPKKAKHHDHQH